jgi:hypothetical protein
MSEKRLGKWLAAGFSDTIGVANGTDILQTVSERA